jgi:hypothetical protein
MGDLAGRLLDGERVLWMGRPKQGLMFGAHDKTLIPFSLLWGGFTVLWEAMNLRWRAASFFAIWGMPFALTGLYLIGGRFLVDAWARRGMTYAITNRRILIERSRPFAKFIAVSLDRLPSAILTESANGRGTIRFGEQAQAWGRNGIISWTPSLDPTPQFLDIPDVRRVSDLVQSLSHEIVRF